jgi:hypothetical protein
MDNLSLTRFSAKVRRYAECPLTLRHSTSDKLDTPHTQQTMSILKYRVSSNDRCGKQSERYEELYVIS